MGQCNKSLGRDNIIMFKYCVLALLLAFAKADFMHDHEVHDNVHVVHETLQPRDGFDSYGAPQAPVLSQEYAAPAGYYPANGFSSNVGIGIGGNAELGTSWHGILRIGLGLILVVMGLTTAAGLIAKLMQTTIFENLFEARYLDMNTIEMVMNSLEKVQEAYGN